ncbi:MAG: flagellar basal body rod protein FlgB [Firmicutes bacterium]|nr:flagellar basal body rod protein FlgB [Bacillota bacterium]
MQELWGSNVFVYLSKGLDAAAMRQNVHANNLSNVNTPNFKRSAVQFEELLKNTAVGVKRLAATSPGHIGRNHSRETPDARTVTDTNTSMRSDGNNVDVDKEMAELAINQLYYNALSQRLSGKLGTLRYVISEGRR